GFFASVRFHNSDHHLASFGLFLPSRLQHRVGLAYPRRHPKENLEFATRRLRLFALHTRENRIWIRPFSLAHAAILRCCRDPCISEAVGETNEVVEVRTSVA